MFPPLLEAPTRQKKLWPQGKSCHFIAASRTSKREGTVCPAPFPLSCQCQCCGWSSASWHSLICSRLALQPIFAPGPGGTTSIMPRGAVLRPIYPAGEGRSCILKGVSLICWKTRDNKAGLVLHVTGARREGAEFALLTVGTKQQGSKHSGNQSVPAL